MTNSILRMVKKSISKPYCTAVIAAAGSSTRMGGEDKLFSELNGIPVIAKTLSVFESCNFVNEIVIVTREESIQSITDICSEYKISKATKIVCGGKERADSVIIGVTEASSSANVIAVQDGDRPLVTEEIIKDAFNEALKYHAAVPAVPVNDTIKTAERGIVEKTLDRTELFAVQTPQIFNAAILKAALQEAKIKNLQFTDESAAVEALGVCVHLTKGSYENIKITTSTDLMIAKAILNGR